MLQGGRVLVVDSYGGSDAYVDAMRDAGLMTLYVTLPEDALQLLTRHPADVVVTEIVFTGSPMEGNTFIREARGRVDDATSIIALSRYVRAADREDAREAGADLFLMKPALAPAVLFEIHRALILRRGGRRLPWNWPRRPVAARSAPIERRTGQAQS